MGNGKTYIGTNNDGTIASLSGSVNTNPYFMYSSNFGRPDEWYLVVGYVFPYD
jgi:hypothetical protein